jgi:hypothetical protein
MAQLFLKGCGQGRVFCGQFRVRFAAAPLHPIYGKGFGFGGRKCENPGFLCAFLACGARCC